MDNLASYFAKPLLTLQNKKRTTRTTTTYTKNKSRSLSPTTASDGDRFMCPECGRAYKLKSSLRNHQKWECGKEPQFKCQYCPYKAKQKMHITRHIERMHKNIDYTAIKSEASKILLKYE